jgi:hypothetical protein
MSTTRYSPEILPEMDFTTPETMNQSVEQRTDFIWKRLLQARKQAEKDGLNGKTSDNIQEGASNQFFTVDKVRRALDAIDPLRYDYRSGRFELNIDKIIQIIYDANIDRIVQAVYDAIVAPGVVITDGVAEPSTYTGKASIYVDTVDGSLKVKFGDGTVKTITTNP